MRGGAFLPKNTIALAWVVTVFCLAQCGGKRERFYPAEQPAATLSVPPDTTAMRRALEVGAEHQVISIAAVGDVMLGAAALRTIEERGCDYPFDSTRTLLRGADIAIANLEAPFTRRGSPFDKRFTFRVPPQWAAGVRNAGFDVLNLANNHILDYGQDGLFDTIATLDSLGLFHCGAGANDSAAAAPALVRVRGKTIAFLGFSTTYPEEFWATRNRAGTCFPFQLRMEKAIKASRAQADHVVVSFHWGAELATTPKDYQRLLAHRAVECGADVVLGHHAHVLQGIEVYRGRLIAYGLGNFAFGSRSESSRESMILKVYLDADGPVLARVIPISVYHREVAFQPRPLRGQDRADALARLAHLSAGLNGGKQILDEQGFVLLSPDRVVPEVMAAASE
jgi:poly-gamma-glutamate synthesis protein (capsule biosynthesis protein)